jgi:hypothetical protein
VTTRATEAQLGRAGTLNHYRDTGQSILFADGHAESLTTPLAGYQMDNVYTYGRVSETSGGDGVVGPPAHAHDAVLLPVAPFDPVAHVDPQTSRRRYMALLWITWVVMLAAAAGLLAWRAVQLAPSAAR